MHWRFAKVYSVEYILVAECQPIEPHLYDTHAYVPRHPATIGEQTAHDGYKGHLHRQDEEQAVASHRSRGSLSNRRGGSNPPCRAPQGGSFTSAAIALKSASLKVDSQRYLPAGRQHGLGRHYRHGHTTTTPLTCPVAIQLYDIAH